MSVCSTTSVLGAGLFGVDDLGLSAAWTGRMVRSAMRSKMKDDLKKKVAFAATIASRMNIKNMNMHIYIYIYIYMYVWSIAACS